MSTYIDGKKSGNGRDANGAINAIVNGKKYYDDNNWGDGGASYGGRYISSMSARELERLPAWQTISGNQNHSWVKTMQSEVAARSAQLRAEELQAAMAESFAMMAEAANRKEDAQEPLKNAAENYDAATAEAQQRQSRRSGLLSLYTRMGRGGGGGTLGGSAGTSTLLGG